MNFTKGDNKITSYSQAFRLDVGTGWDVPPGMLQAPGSLCTYEPQKASDVFAMYQSLVNEAVIDEALLWYGTPKDRIGDYDQLLEVIDWELNLDPNIRENRFMEQITVRAMEEMEDEGYDEKCIVYKSKDISSKEMTVHPVSSVVI